MPERTGEPGEILAIGRVAGDDTENPPRDPGQIGRRGGRRNSRQMAVVDVRRGDHRAGIDVPDYGNDRGIPDEFTGNARGLLSASFVITHNDLKLAAADSPSAVDVLQCQLDAAAVHRAVALGPWTCCSESVRFAAAGAPGEQQTGSDHPVSHRSASGLSRASDD